MYFFYSLLTLAAFVVISPYFLYQAIRYQKYVGGLRQRLGYLPLSFNLDADDSIWIHAVSVGEVLTARALVPELRARYPRLRLFVSTTTMTGQQVARTHLQDVDGVFFFPYLHLRFVEIPSASSGLAEIEPPADAGASPEGEAAEAEPDLELDEDFLRRIREV